jgi:type I restriction enzyme S subunit
MGEVANIPQLRFPEFDQPLLTDILLNLTDVLRCGIAATPKYVDSGITFLSSQNVTPTGKILMDKCNFISEDYYKKISKNAKLLKGDILYSRVGARYGNAAIFPFEGDYGVYVSLTHIRASQKLDNTFLKFLLNSPIGKTQAKKGVFQGGGVPNLNVKVVEKFKINFPSKPEQQKIAAFLTAVDAKIEQLIKKKELLDEYKKGLMQQIFSQAIRFKADDGSDFPDWKEKKLENVLKRTSTGLNPRQNFKLGYGENYYVTIKNISNGKLDFSKCERIDENAMTMIANRSDLSKGDLIMSSIGNVGESYLLDKEPENWNINESVFMLRASELMLPQFLYFIITNEQSKWYLESNSTGSSFKSIKLGELKLLPLGLPSLEEQTKIANFLSSIDTKIEQVGKQLDESKQFKKALLQQMFV